MHEMYAGTVIAALLSVVPFVRVSTQAICENVTSGSDNGGSCSFQNSQFCGWTNVANVDDLDWELEDNSFYGTNSYLVLKMASASSGNVGYFRSPSFCSTGNDLRSLSFRYSIEFNNRCRLSVYLITGANATEVWTTSSGTGVSFSDRVDPIYFRCPGDEFQIVFVGEKLSNRRCGKSYNEIDIDDIRYTNSGQSRTQGYQCPAVTRVTTEQPTTLRTTTTTRATTTVLPPVVLTRMPPVTGNTGEPSMNATLDGRTNSKTDDDGGLSGGAVAGIVIVVIAIIAVAVIIVGIFLMRRKRAKAKPKKTQQSLQHTNSISNSMYMLAHHNVAGNRPDIIPSAPPQPEYINTSVYNVPETADSSPIYSVPDDLDLPPSASKSPQESTRYELSTALQPLDTVAGAGSMENRKNGGKGSGLSAEAYNKSRQSRYNELFLRGNGSQSGGRKSGDTYDHLNEENARERIEAGTNSTAENEYSLAQDEHDTPHSHVYTNSNTLNQQENEYSFVYEESKPSLGCDSPAQNNDDSSEHNNEYSLAQHQGAAGESGNVKDVTENEYANFHNPTNNAAENGTKKNDDYNRLDFEDAAYSSSQVPGEKMEYYNACEKNENYDHLQNDQDCSQGAGEAVYRNLGFEENEYEI